MPYDTHIGIDYSGAATTLSRSPTLQVYASNGRQIPEKCGSPVATANRPRNWNRSEIAQWLIDQAKGGKRFIAGIDHGFSFPCSYFQHYQLNSWWEFLEDFCCHWPLDHDGKRVEDYRPHKHRHFELTGTEADFRLTEKWTGAAKSVFLSMFRVPLRKARGPVCLGYCG